ncbi:MAG: hypothetical protein ACHQC8_01860 [Solirubrobacterales bacterium]
MTEDLLRRIQREMHERLRELRGAVDEHDRLTAELRALQDTPEAPASVDPVPPVDREPLVASEPPAALEAVPEPLVASEAPVALDIAPELPVNVVRLPARPQLSRTRMVSPKVARLMHTPRRPALERSGIVRVGAGRLDRTPDEPVDGVDVEAEVYERSL